MSLWFWRGYFNRPPMVLKHEDAGKAVAEVSFQVMQETGLPDGDQLYTLGDPESVPIFIEPSTS
jgi:urease gamma subunit